MSEKKRRPEEEPEASRLKATGELDYPEDFGWPEAVSEIRESAQTESDSIDESDAGIREPVTDSMPDADLEWPEDVPLLNSQHGRESSVQTPFSEDLDRISRTGGMVRGADELLDLPGLESEGALLPEPWESPVQTEATEPPPVQKHGSEDSEEVKSKPDPTAAPGIDLGGLIDWEIRKPGRFSDFVLDDGTHKFFFRDSMVREIKSLHDLESYIVYLADFPQAEGAGLLDVVGAMKYSEILGRKRLEEQGILSPEGSLHFYYKRRKGKDLTSLFYNVLPKDSFEGLQQSYMEYKPGFILYDSLGFLYAVLKTMSARETHALAMRVGESIVLIAGRGKEVFFGSRYHLLGNSPAHIADGLMSVKRDLELGHQNLAAKIKCIEWIESGTEKLDLRPPESAIPIETWPVSLLNFQGREFYSALPLAMKKIGTAAALGPRAETWLRPLEKMEKWLWLSLLILVIVAGLGSVFFIDLARTARETLNNVKLQADALEKSMPVLPHYSTEGVQETLELARTLEAAARAPAVSSLWNSIARAKDEYIRLDRIEMQYEPDFVDVTLEGLVELNLEKSQQAYNAFLDRLESEGFAIEQESLHIDLSGNIFDVSLRYAGAQGGYR